MGFWFTELIAWQLARELKLRVYALVKQPAVARDVKFVDQITDAADRGFIDNAQLEADLRLADRAIGAATRLRQYILSPRNPYR